MPSRHTGERRAPYFVVIRTQSLGIAGAIVADVTAQDGIYRVAPIVIARVLVETGDRKNFDDVCGNLAIKKYSPWLRWSGWLLRPSEVGPSGCDSCKCERDA